MFKNAIDIMLFNREEPKPPPIDVTTEKESPELRQEKAPSKSLRVEVVEKLKPLVQFFSAQEARKLTEEAIRKNAEVAIREEATEILKKSVEAISFAISDEKYFCEIGGPGRHENAHFCLRQAVGNYRDDSREEVLNQLRAQGYKAEFHENIFLKIEW